MEKNLERVMEEICNNPGVLGCIFADKQGLYLGAKGHIATESAGVITAIAEQAAKLEPQSKMPIITFESDNRLCMIQRSGDVTGAIIKNVHM